MVPWPVITPVNRFIDLHRIIASSSHRIIVSSSHRFIVSSSHQNTIGVVGGVILKVSSPVSFSTYSPFRSAYLMAPGS